METSQEPKSSVLIAHIADVHLRDTQYATSKRGGDFFDAFMRAIEAAAGHTPRPDCIVCAGDVFDNSRPSARMIGQLMQIDARLKELNMPMITGTGNHDYSTPTWLSTLFPSASMQKGGVYPIDGCSVLVNGIGIYGIPPYSTTAFRERQAEIDIATQGSAVLIYHNLISGIVPLYTGEKQTLDVAELPVHQGTKAILLGDIHIQGYVKRARPGGGECLIGYPGALEICKENEPVEKSIPLIRVATDADAEVVGTIPTRTRKFIHAKVRSVEELDTVAAEVSAAAAQHPLVLVDFDRKLTQTVPRLHALLDVTQAVLRCHPLPSQFVAEKRTNGGDGDRLTLGYFVSKRFKDRPDLDVIATALLQRGDTDAANIVSDFVDKRNQEIAEA